MPDLAACLNYAIAYGGANRNNAVYADLSNSGGDCANFVSQCLAAGGFENDPGLAADQVYNSATQWWNRKDGTSYSSKAWRGAISIQTYWGARYSIVNIAVDMSNIYPGNPIFTNNNGHVAICTGYSTAGTPLHSGHTSNVDQMPIVCGTGDNYYGKTMLIQTGYCSGAHTSGAMVHNSLWHWHKCTVCGAGATSPTAHSYTLVNSKYVCTVCGYETDITPVLPASVCMEL